LPSRIHWWISGGVATLPADVHEIYGLRVPTASRADVEVTTRERLRYLAESNYSSETIYAAIVGTTVEFYGITAGELEVHAKYTPIALVTASVNAVLTQHPGVYLFGALVELFDHLRDAESKDTYLGRYGQAVAAANTGGRYSGTQARAKLRGRTP
jgi:hypothetical protein